MPFYKPTVVISKCLLNGKCNNGCLEDFINKFQNYSTLIPMCPLEHLKYGGKEEDFYVEFSDDYHLMNRREKKNYSAHIHNYVNDIINNKYHINGFILKEQSSTCGLKDINVFDKKGRFIEKAEGYFPITLKRNIYSIYVDESILSNSLALDNFLSKIYCFTEFEEIKYEKDLQRLNHFHIKNKYLIKLFDHNSYEILNSIITNNNEECFIMYGKILETTLNNNYDNDDFKRIIHEIMDSYKDYTNLKERKYISDLMSDFDNKFVSRSILEFITKNNLIRFNIEKDFEQTFFSRYPKQLRIFTEG